ncbi:LysE family translocator [Psychromonas sp.]|nr:LysE family translocator [Psychromonas sp.]
MEFHTLILFTVACLSINLIPGPDVIYIVSNTMKGKMASGMKAALGLGVGYFVHTIAACLGLSAIILSSALAFAIIKWLGAAYLLYLGIMSLKSMWQGNSKLSISNHLGSENNVFKQGVVVSVLNPKVALFFLSFLPQFIDVTAGTTNIQLLFLGLLFSVLATLCNVIYAVAGNWLLSSPKASRYTRVIEGVSGVLLVGLAGKIALSK